MAAIASVRWVRGLRRRKQAFPEAYDADKATAKGSRTKLGSLSIVTVKRGDRKITIVNGYSQFHWRGSGVVVDYAALCSVMRQVKVMLLHPNSEKACAAAGVVGVTFHDLRGTSEVSALGMHRGGDRDLDRT